MKGKRSSSYSSGKDLRGISKLLIEATKGVTGLVESMHKTIAKPPRYVSKAASVPINAILTAIYGVIKSSTDIVGQGIDTFLAAIQPILDDHLRYPEEHRKIFLAALNGVVGDHLEDVKNSLRIDMELLVRNKLLPLTAEAAKHRIPEVSSGRIMLVVHGSCMSAQQWKSGDKNSAQDLADAAGYETVFINYNSGLHISLNGQKLAKAIEDLHSIWPVPVTDVSFLCHSMGGLVSRSALSYAQDAGSAWCQQVKHMMFLGTPHHGAPLEQGGNWLEILLEHIPYTAPLAKLAQIRSNGVTDLRFGYLRDEDWQGTDGQAVSARHRSAVPLPESVDCFAVAGCLQDKSKYFSDHLLGDGLVPVNSAIGKHSDPTLHLNFSRDNILVVQRLNHVELLHSNQVFNKLSEFLGNDGE